MRASHVPITLALWTFTISFIIKIVFVSKSTWQIEHGLILLCVSQTNLQLVVLVTSSFVRRIIVETRLILGVIHQVCVVLKCDFGAVFNTMSIIYTALLTRVIHKVNGIEIIESCFPV